MIALILRPKNIGLLALLLFGIITSCTKVDAGGNEKVDKRFDDLDFDKISYELGGELNFTQAPTTQVTVTTTQEALEGIDVFVKKKTLYIKRKKGYSIKNQDELKFDIKDDDTYEIYVCGSGDVIADFDESYKFDEHLLKVSGSGSISADYIDATGQVSRTSGSGAITIQSVVSNSTTAKTSGSGLIMMDNLVCKNAYLDISGSGSININHGAATEVETDIHGSGDYSAYDFQTIRTDFFSCGSGTAFLRATSTLDVDVSGSGDLFYKGYPEINSTVSGSGNIYDAN